MKIKLFATNMAFTWIMMLSLHEAQAFYNPSTGRWLSRDPISEQGGKNLYFLVENDSVAHYDYLGLQAYPFPPRPPSLPPQQPPASGITWGKLCLPKARRILTEALNSICSKIASPEFAACMGAGLGGEYAASLKSACSLRNFKIECNDACRIEFGDKSVTRPACARGSDKERTIWVYSNFWSDQCGTKPCMMGHELLHMIGSFPHSSKRANRTFDMLNRCLGCEATGYDDK
jgi:hypothetical protein